MPPAPLKVIGKSIVFAAEVIVCVPLVAEKVVVFVPAVYVPKEESSVRFPYIVLKLFGKIPANPVKFKFLYVGVVAVSVRVYVPVVMFIFKEFVSEGEIISRTLF